MLKKNHGHIHEVFEYSKEVLKEIEFHASWVVQLSVGLVDHLDLREENSVIREEEQECKDFFEDAEEPEDEDFGVVEMFFEFGNFLPDFGGVFEGPEESQYFAGHSDLIVDRGEEAFVGIGVESGVLDESEELI